MMLLLVFLLIVMMMIVSSLSLSLSISSSNLLLIRGGKSSSKYGSMKKKYQQDYNDDDDNDDGNDDDDDDDDDDDGHMKKRYDDDDDYDNDDDEQDNDNDNDNNNRNEQDNDDDDDGDDDDDDDEKQLYSKKKKPTSVVDTGVKGISTLANFAVKLTKKSIKSSVDFLASAHVMQSKILGKWRLHQEIEVRKGIILSCPATIEFLDDSTLSTFFNDEEYKSEYSFKEKNWPQKCSISFNAKAFQGPKDAEPINLYYHGYFKRSLLNPNIIFIRGKVYSLKGKSFWKQQKKIGKFKLTKSRY